MSEPVLPDIKNIKSSESYTLPSKGLLYKPEDNIPASITIRRMTTKEDKIRMRNQSSNIIRRDILQACVLENVDVGKLKLVDANFLLFKLRSLSFLTDIYKVRCLCPYCDTQFVHEVNLLEIPTEYMTKKKLENLKVKLPVSGVDIGLKYPNLNDTIRMGDSLQAYKEQFPNADIQELLYTAASVIYVDTINGDRPILEEAEDWMDKLDILDSRKLLDTINKLDDLYGFQQTLETPCPNCGNTVRHGLPITDELFTPSE